MKRFCCFLRVFFILVLPVRFLNAAPSAPLISADLRTQPPSWQIVIGGEAVSPCAETSYGIAVVSDGRMLSACTESGTVLWQRRIKGKPTPYIASSGDFLYVVTDKSRLNLINPSGRTVWSATCPFDINGNPVVGKDGRVFVRGKKGVACYGLNGVRKWHCETEQLSGLALSVLNDGSFLLFLAQPSDGKTVAVRFSPFGERLEDVTLSGIVSAAASSDEGVLVSLDDGAIGLVKVAAGKAVSQWSSSPLGNGGAFCITSSPESRNSVFFFQNGTATEALVVRTESGAVLNRFPVGQIPPGTLRLAKPSMDGYILSGAYSACGFREDGTIVFAVVLPSGNSWNFLQYTKNGYLVVCMKDWTINAYRMSQAPGKKEAGMPHKCVPYALPGKSPAAGEGFGDSQKLSEIASSLRAGDYALREKEYLSLLTAESDSYRRALAQKSSGRQQNFYSDYPLYTQDIFLLASRTGTGIFSSFFADTLHSETDLSLLSSCIFCAGMSGYDEDGRILAEFERLILDHIPPDETDILKTVCDATYRICIFMGRPAFNRQGKDILVHFFSPQYDRTLQEYARKTLEKMISSE